MADDTSVTTTATIHQDEITSAPAEPTTAVERLRAFEDREFGPDAVRINDQIERGYGSPFKDMSEAKHRVYAVLEKLVAAEQKLADAHGALIQADADHEAAKAAVDAVENESDHGG